MKKLCFIDGSLQEVALDDNGVPVVQPKAEKKKPGGKEPVVEKADAPASSDAPSKETGGVGNQDVI